MLIHPSIVTHWKTVSIAKPMLSKEVIPWLGPSHFSRQCDTLTQQSRTGAPLHHLRSQVYAPVGVSSVGPSQQGTFLEPSVTISSGGWDTVRISDTFETVRVQTNHLNISISVIHILTGWTNVR